MWIPCIISDVAFLLPFITTNAEIAGATSELYSGSASVSLSSRHLLVLSLK